MADPIAYRRTRIVVNAFGAYPSDDYRSVLEALKEDVDMRSDFMTRDRETQELKLISDNAILGWFHTARYWELIDKEAGQLTDVGHKLHSRKFETQFQSHLGEFVTRWNADLNSIVAVVDRFDGTDGQWPTLSNWYAAVSGMEGVQIPQTRFRQLAYFLVGIGLVKRAQLTLYTSS